VGERDFMESVWYRRFFKVPKNWLDKRVLLHFGAVDYEATVWVNGCKIGLHRGGYTPFTFDITSLVKPNDNELTVWVTDECRSGLQPTGKQSHRLKSYSCLYTRVTGIWQTVWLESVPQQYIKYFQILADPYSGNVSLKVHIDNVKGRYILSAYAQEGGKIVAEAEVVSSSSTNCICMNIPNPHPWSPEDPHLYTLILKLYSQDKFIDEVHSYFGLREVRRLKNKILINNKPRFLRFVLDQGYYPDGIYTAPSDEALRRDIELAKDMGFDGARLHQKVFEPRFLYWADKLGYLVAGEFPDWGADLTNALARERLLDEWVEAVRRDINHPCIIMWTPFNERAIRMGDEEYVNFVRRVVKITRMLDSSRLIIDCSGWTHVDEEIDIYDVHDYEQNLEAFKSHYSGLTELSRSADINPTPLDFRPPMNFLRNAPYRGQPFIVSEYGGIWWNPPGMEVDGSWGYGERPKSIEDFIARYKSLTESLIFNNAISGFCYTQLYDIEQETNGLYTYNRKPKVNPRIIRRINRQKAAIEEETA
jgi:beta-galactosidase/beta-glucuronidase